MLTTFPHSPYNEDYISFDPANYIQNPIALARIRAPLSREELAQRLGISVFYLGKIERSTQVREKMLARVKGVLSGIQLLLG
jgi:ribosome-binding protein aMBF1 (putative translation factor)